MRERIAAGFRTIISGHAEGTPEWVHELAEGEDTGYFGVDSAVWAVHAHLATLVGGVRALLMQALHPAAVAGVDQHSTYRQDPLGRLAGTTRWLTVTTFGSIASADREAARVRGMHRRVQGTYEVPGDPHSDEQGPPRTYRADDEHLLAWVHIAFTDSFRAAHAAFGGPIPGGPDAYVREWATAAQMIGLREPPRSAAELSRALDGFGPELARSQATDRTLAFLKNPPLPTPAKLGYRLLFDAAVSTLRPEHRDLLGLRVPNERAARLGARAMLAALGVALGPEPPAATFSRRRLDRLRHLGEPTSLELDAG